MIDILDVLDGKFGKYRLKKQYMKYYYGIEAVLFLAIAKFILFPMMHVLSYIAAMINYVIR